MTLKKIALFDLDHTLIPLDRRSEEDAIVSASHNSEQLHRDVAGSELTLLPGAGHMIQHLSQQTLIKAIERVQGQTETPRLSVVQA